jgi:hypothetical protein
VLFASFLCKIAVIGILVQFMLSVTNCQFIAFCLVFLLKPFYCSFNFLFSAVTIFGRGQI